MSTLADRTIASLRAEHDQVAAVVGTLSAEDLVTTSGASEWAVADVLSHLGSGAEISMASLRAALGTAPAPAAEFNQGVWDRWNALPPREQADESIKHDAELVAAIEALDGPQRADLQVTLGFLPAPISVATFAGMRLNESVLHGWDVRAGFEPAAVIGAEPATVLLEHLSGDLAFLLGFIGKAAEADERIVLEVDRGDYVVIIDNSVGSIALTKDAGPATARFAGPPEAALRLLAGRLTPAHTPGSVAVTGNTTLDELRRVFPGY